MKRMFSALILIIAVLLIIGFGVYYFRGSVTASALSKKLGTVVSLRDINFKSPNILINGFKMDNPRGFRNPYALQVQTTDIDTPFANYKHKVVHINKIELSNLELDIELPAGQAPNWDIIFRKMPRKRNAEGSYAIINSLVINNLHVTVTMADGRVKETTLDRLEYTNIKTNSGDLAEKITRAVLSKLMFNVMKILELPLKFVEDGIDFMEHTPPIEELFNMGG